MKAKSFDVPPIDRKTVHQFIDERSRISGGIGSQVGITRGRENAAVAKDLLYLEQINAGFD
jgi:hypothetical protein